MKKARVAKSRSKSNLPEELCREILSYLPVKSLLRFLAVSRSWRMLIADPDFARTHLTRFNINNNRHESLLFVHQDKDRNTQCVVRCTKTFRTTTRLGFPGTPITSIVGSVDGLFLLKKKRSSAAGELELVLWNPSVRKTLILPPPPAISDFEEFGLGFDPLIKDYKYVRFSLGSIAVYSVRSNSWKTIGLQQSEISGVGHLRRALCFRGFLFALTRCPFLILRSPLKLVVFDLSKEVFGSTNSPANEDDDPKSDSCRQGLTIGDGGSSMQLVSLFREKGCVWVLDDGNDFGADVKSWSWTQRYTFDATKLVNEWKLRFLHLKKNGEILFWRKNKVISHNLETQEERNIVLRKNVFYTWPYMESLSLLSLLSNCC